MKLKRKFGLIFYLVPVIVLVLVLLYGISVAKKETKAEGVAYQEISDISYKVQLKPNTYYDSPYLDKGYNIIANLIDKVILNYDYQQTFSSDVNYKITYGVTAELVIFDTNSDEKPIYTKTFTLMENKEEYGSGLMAKLSLVDNEVVYDEYNAIVAELRKEVVTDANLIIKFNTSFEGTSLLLDEPIRSSKTSTLTVPISQKTINIDIKSTRAHDEGYISANKKISIGTIILICITIFLLIVVTVAYIYYVFTSAKKRTKYEQELSRILREFDRAITEARGKPRIDKSNNTIEVKDFMELLDVHDNFNIPILYYKINRYMCVFMVRNNNDIYYNVMRSEDYED